ncbi:uncharacterized protein MYCFIDRAFT_204618 [Pseudocercospora fijiensis CIRAD86]|uniref:Secreted protein n=1 Tax=Pseudocercospora fijiensis (strain CIRAD86) TaxID=383855 RepID=M3ATT0_PSEFD|nr:uncharacterized protein MYCFIDRAFT_204618 [Pseudocercospora fijiensis CIRAD86]EME80563.1 hypothetical protein MYCFIDRAFT_204618 [Pseudocercospora fijiensis CIRAD86]
MHYAVILAVVIPTAYAHFAKFYNKYACSHQVGVFNFGTNSPGWTSKCYSLSPSAVSLDVYFDGTQEVPCAVELYHDSQCQHFLDKFDGEAPNRSGCFDESSAINSYKVTCHRP